MFALVGAGEEPSTRGARKVDAFRIFLMMHLAVRGWVTIEPHARGSAYAFACAMTACFAASFVPKLARHATIAAALLMAGKLALTLPGASNHLFVECVLIALAALLDGRDATEREIFARACKWLALIVLFYSGLQKLLYGTYFRGQFLAFTTAQVDTFTTFFAHLLPDGELARLRSHSPLDPAAGPYRVDAPLFLLVSNASYVLEMLCPVLLLVRRTRAIGVLATLALVLGIELAAREVFFGMLFVQTVLLFRTDDLNRKLLPVAGALYAYFLAMRLGVLPAWSFTN